MAPRPRLPLPRGSGTSASILLYLSLVAVAVVLAAAAAAAAVLVSRGTYSVSRQGRSSSTVEPRRGRRRCGAPSRAAGATCCGLDGAAAAADVGCAGCFAGVVLVTNGGPRKVGAAGRRGGAASPLPSAASSSSSSSSELQSELCTSSAVFGTEQSRPRSASGVSSSSERSRVCAEVQRTVAGKAEAGVHADVCRDGCHSVDGVDPERERDGW